MVAFGAWSNNGEGAQMSHRRLQVPWLAPPRAARRTDSCEPRTEAHHPTFNYHLRLLPGHLCNLAAYCEHLSAVQGSRVSPASLVSSVSNRHTLRSIQAHAIRLYPPDRPYNTVIYVSSFFCRSSAKRHAMPTCPLSHIRFRIVTSHPRS